jgi:riboflavin synthase
MFTGIVQAVGKIVATAPRGDGLRLVVDSATLDISDVSPGDSIAVNGCCLTVVAKETRKKEGARIAFDVSAETLRTTTGLDASGDVNLEKALRLSDRLGGHLMTGHVDGVGTVILIRQGDRSVVEAGGNELEARDPATGSPRALHRIQRARSPCTA